MQAVFFGFLVAGPAAFAAGNAVVELFPQPIRNTSNSSIAVPFGSLQNIKFSESSLVRTAQSEWDLNNIASDESWYKFKNKGLWYGCLLDMDNEKAGGGLRDPRTPPSAESIWQGDVLNSIRTWGWHEATYNAAFNCDFRDDIEVESSHKIGIALASMGLSQIPVGAGGDNECYSIEHYDETLVDEGEEVPLEEQWYIVNDREYPCTGAHYRFAMNRKGGAIFAQNLVKPESAAVDNLGGEIPDDQLPQLRRASDIMWAYWIQNNPNPKNLYSYFVNYVRNDDTLPLIARIIRSHGMTTLPYWPGLELSMDDEGAEALLGKRSPIGATITHFLLQHKSVLGIKNFESIVIYRDNVPEGAPGWQNPDTELLFKIIDVPLDEVDDSDQDMPDAPARKVKRADPLAHLGPSNVVREHRVVVRLDSE